VLLEQRATDHDTHTAPTHTQKPRSLVRKKSVRVDTNTHNHTSGNTHPRWNKPVPRIRPHSAKLSVLSKNLQHIASERKEASTRSGPAAIVKSATVFDKRLLDSARRTERAVSGTSGYVYTCITGIL
jgi:hypothetical protein